MRDELLSLLRCPINYRTSFSGYVTNGYWFHTQSRKKNLQTQNSGLFVLGNMGAGMENIDYYDILTRSLGWNIWEAIMSCYFDVIGGMCMILVEGVKVDKFGFFNLNGKRLLLREMTLSFCQVKRHKCFIAMMLLVNVTLLLSKCNLVMYMIFLCPVKVKLKLRIILLIRS